MFRNEISVTSLAKHGAECMYVCRCNMVLTYQLSVTRRFMCRCMELRRGDTLTDC